MKRSFTWFVILLMLCLGKCSKLPSTVKICRRSDPDLNSCFQQAVQGALPLLRYGIPTVGLGPQEPLKIDSMTINGTEGPMNVRQNLQNIKIYGVIYAIVDKADVKIGDDMIEATFHMTIPKAKTYADYDFIGKILMLPISGNGNSSTDFENAKAIAQLKAAIVERNGKDYLEVTESRVELIPDKVTLKLDNLFNGNQELGDEMNRVINENWKELYEEVKDNYNKSLAGVLKDLANKLFSKVTYEQLIPK